MIRRSVPAAHSAPSGQSLVEFALILPVFVLVLVGIIDFGRAIYAYSTINNAAHEGGRWAVVDQTATHIQDRAAEHAVSLGIAPGDVDIDYRLATSLEVSGSCDGNLGKDEIYGCVAVIRVPYDYSAVTPIIGSLVGTLNLVGEARFPVEHNCVWPSKPKCPVAE